MFSPSGVDYVRIVGKNLAVEGHKRADENEEVSRFFYVCSPTDKNDTLNNINNSL